VDAEEFEPFTAGLSYPMLVLTVPAVSQPRPSGCLVGFATQCSISPVRFLICVSKQNHTYRALNGVDFVGVHLLDDGARDLAELFGTNTGDEVDKFARCRWSSGPANVPILDRCESWFVGGIHRWLDLGDHVGLLLTPIQVAGAPTSPLMLSDVHDLRAGHEA
jgi:flavin reductase (DIM6/NTAB) family NADH-FMN oxidoreductase RutF